MDILSLLLNIIPIFPFLTLVAQYRENGMSYAGETICDDFSIVESAALPPSSSAQVAEPINLHRVRQLPFIQTPDMLLDVNA